MNSSSRPRARVLRGAAAIAVRPMGFEVDLAKPLPLPVIDTTAIDAAVERGYHDGVAAGHRDGYQAGVAAARDEVASAERQRAAVVEDLLTALEQAAAALRQAQAATMTGIEDEIAGAAFAVAEAVVAKELELSSDPGRDAIARALALAPEGDAVVRLNPADMATLGQLAAGREITVLADPTVEAAGAIVEIGACRIDAQISAAIERVRKVLTA
ncbi:MAG: Flagellar assembly protein FliH [Actinomycetia bacterium]|jgi:flagellar assembly protein FliH|nr:Flagellar assembly protein FliH [Actinomycetes bacterium]